MDNVLELPADIWRSFRSMPTWVQVWVAWLVGINLASVGQQNHQAGRLTVKALWVWLLPNTILAIWIRGLGKVHGLPHLVAYPVLIVALFRRARADDASAEERRFAWIVLLTNAVSTAFDILDAVALARDPSTIRDAATG